MFWLKTCWEFIVEWSSKAWEAIKKLPGWAVVVLLMSFAIVAYLMKANRLQKRRAEAELKLKDIQIEYSASKVEAETTNTVEVKALKTKRDEAREELKKVEEQIDEAAKQGPVGLANEWKAFLSGGK